MLDCCIIGGGIIGLSIARELAGRGLSVRVLSRESTGRTASWAAAGIFPPAPRHDGETPNDLLTSWSDQLHREWSRELHDETGIDNELVCCGGLYVATDTVHMQRLLIKANDWRSKGARCDVLDAGGVADREPGVRGAVDRGAIVGGYFLPDEAQIRPPRHLAALEESCRRRGVEISSGVAVESVDLRHGAIAGVEVTRDGGGRETVRAGAFCLAAGAWSGPLAQAFRLTVETRPIRGQIALYRFPTPPLHRIVNIDVEYLVPRRDGRLLVGSTLEDAGYDAGTTQEAIARLRTVAAVILGDLANATLEQVWAGLRPGSADGLPSLGRVPGCRNAFIAAGHFRAGLHQSTGTAVLIADLITDRPPPLDVAPFAPDRPRTASDPLMPR